MEPIKVLDHGYVKFIEAWGHGEAGIRGLPLYEEEGHDFECGIIEAARQSTQGNFRGWEADEKLLSYLFCNKPPHSTPFEFAGMVIEVRAPIFVFREWHRHRTQSYNEMSARYAPLPDLNYIPTVERCMLNSTKNKQAGTIKGSDELTEKRAEEFRTLLAVDYDVAETHYQQWLQAGVPKELARVVLPVGRYSQMRASTCLRNWLAFLTLRMDENAQWEIREYAKAVATIAKEKFPHTWKLFSLQRDS